MAEELEEHNLLILHLEEVAQASRLPSNVIETHELAEHTALPDAHHTEEHSHPTHGDIDFTGSISVGGEAGLTGSRTIDGHTLTFKNGLLVGYEAP